MWRVGWSNAGWGVRAHRGGASSRAPLEGPGANWGHVAGAQILLRADGFPSVCELVVITPAVASRRTLSLSVRRSDELLAFQLKFFRPWFSISIFEWQLLSRSFEVRNFNLSTCQKMQDTEALRETDRLICVSRVVEGRFRGPPCLGLVRT